MEGPKASPQRGRTYEKEVYSYEEIQALLARTQGSAPTAVRNAAIIATLWQSGLRISELLDLEPRDFHFQRREIFIRHGKGDRPRRVSVGPDAIEATRQWLEVRAQFAGPAAPIFCTLKSGRLFGTYVRAMLQRLAVEAGWEKRIHPHAFRHTFAANLARSGVPVPYIQRQLGHESLATTSIYLAAISTEDIAEAMTKVDWNH